MGLQLEFHISQTVPIRNTCTYDEYVLCIQILHENSEIIPPCSINKIALNKRSLHTYTPYLPDSWSHAVPALPEQNSMPIGWGNLGDLSYWLKIPQICCCYTWGCLDQRWGRKVPQPIPQNFAESDLGLIIYIRQNEVQGRAKKFLHVRIIPPSFCPLT